MLHGSRNVARVPCMPCCHSLVLWLFEWLDNLCSSCLMSVQRIISRVPLVCRDKLFPALGFGGNLGQGDVDVVGVPLCLEFS